MGIQKSSVKDNPPINEDGKQQLVCIECEAPCSKLYSLFPNSNNLKIEHCERCKLPVDKYIEYDVTLCLLDLMLLNKAVWRHMLFNQRLKDLHWKLAAVCLFCDGYMKWVLSSSTSETRTPENNVVFQAAKQIELYIMTFESALQITFYLLFTVAFTFLWLHKPTETSNWFDGKVTSIHAIVRCLLLANSGKLLIIPAIIWTQQDSLVYLQVILLYILVCAGVSLSTLTHCRFDVAFLIVLFSHALSLVVMQPISGWIHTLSSTM